MAQEMLKRRMVVLRLASLGAVPAVGGCVVAPTMPISPPPGATGLTDADPADRPGYGRGGYRGRFYTGITDADPADRPGYGRGGYYPRRVTDTDPYDAPGRGRGW